MKSYTGGQWFQIRDHWVYGLSPAVPPTQVWPNFGDVVNIDGYAYTIAGLDIGRPRGQPSRCLLGILVKQTPAEFHTESGEDSDEVDDEDDPFTGIYLDFDDDDDEDTKP